MTLWGYLGSDPPTSAVAAVPDSPLKVQRLNLIDMRELNMVYQ
jgi:hypothetical protein